MVSLAHFIASSQVYFNTNFESNDVGIAFERSLWQAEGFNTAGWDQGLSSRTQVDNLASVSGLKSLKIMYPKGEFGTANTGCQIPLTFEPQNEVYMSYNLRFSENFSWGTENEGGKLPGLAGGANCSGGSDCSSGTEGFTCRFMWRPGGQAVLYLYHMDKPDTYGENIPLLWSNGDEVVFDKGKWYHIMERVKINTNGSTYDGEVQVWVNGEEVLFLTGIRFTSNGDKIDNLYISTFHGGSDAGWAPTDTCYTWLDDVTISSNMEDTRYKICSGPNLGSNTSFCAEDSVQLYANVNAINAVFQWVKDGMPLENATSSSYTALDTGEFVLLYDSLGCHKKDTIVVSNALHPNLGYNRTICSSSYEILMANDEGNGYTYTWLFNDQLIEGADSSTYPAYHAGTYTVEISAGSCANATSEVVLSSGLLSIADASGTPTNAVSLSVNELGDNFGWYDTQNGGNAFHVGRTYNAIVGENDRIYYVADESAFVAQVGKKSAPISWTENRFERKMRFEVYESLRVEKITVFAVEAQDITIRVVGGDEATVVAQKTFFNEEAGKLRLNLGFELEPGLYYMDAVGSTGSLLISHEGDSDIHFPYEIPNKIALLGSNLSWIDAKPYYMFFYDWEISGGNTCARTPVAVHALSDSVRVLNLEAEDAMLNGLQVATSRQGYSGSGYVTGMDNAGESIIFEVDLTEAGFYNCGITYNGPYGDKKQDVFVNGMLFSDVDFPATDSYAEVEVGVFTLHAGLNTVEIRASWSWTDFDKITLTQMPPPEPIDYSLVTPNLIDPDANEKTQGLYAFMRSQYGKRIISGQTDNFESLVTIAGESPVQRAFDFSSYTVGYPYLWDSNIGGHVFGWTDNGTTQEAIDWYNSTGGKGIVSFQWHWHSPSGGVVSQNNFRTSNTTFNVSLAIQSGTSEHTEILRDIDSIASQLKRLESAGVPVLWRPLHEAGGQWFWWGASSAADCLALWDIMYNRLTNFHNIHNLIWVWSTPEPEWYPGNNKVDIIGYDSYPGEFVYVSQKQKFNQLYEIVEGKKLVAMTENGPIPNIDQCISDDAMWSYFSSWDELVSEQNSVQHIQEVFAHDSVLTLSDFNNHQTVFLQDGWNLISFYLDPETPSVEAVFPNAKVVKTNEEFWSALVDLDLNGLSFIHGGVGYLVYNEGAETVEVYGLKSFHLPPMESGWNLVAVMSNEPISVSELSADVLFVKDFEAFYEPGNNLSELVELIPGKAYFVRK